MALKDIKAKIGATKRMHTVTRAMEAVSAAKMRKTQARALQGRAYARAALSVLTRLAGTAEVKAHPLGKEHATGDLALVVITSDKGLAGALNSSVLKQAVASVEGRDPATVAVYAYGKKGEEFFRRRGYRVMYAAENRRDEVPVEDFEALALELTTRYEAEEYSKVLVAYSNFRSTFEQIPTLRRLLPLSLPALQEIVQGIVPAKGQWSDENGWHAPREYAVEPEHPSVVDHLIPRLITVALYHMLLEAKASEHSARMVAMKNASDKSKEVVKALTIKFNKARQAKITAEISEITAGVAALE